MSQRLFLKCLFSALALLAAAPACASSHVRVILDTSGSMVDNDKPRLAVLSTLLLFDLTKPNLSRGDSFAVLPFDRNLPKWTSGPPPTPHAPWIRAERDKRSEFQNALKAVVYNAQRTYYFPFLKAAIDDLENQGSPNDRRMIVLVTDGLPEDPHDGLDRIRTELAPQLLREKIKLYILALGPQANSKRDDIHNALGGPAVGEMFPDPDGSQIPENMMKIFSRSFGYTGSPGGINSSSVDIDLEGSQTADRVAVVVYWRNPAQPSVQVRTGNDNDVNNPEGVQGGEVQGSSYAMRWVLSPQPGRHKILTNAMNGRFVVLRPAELILEIQPQDPNGQIYSAIADPERGFPLRVVVRAASGNRGAIGPVQLSFQVHGPKDPSKPSGYAWDDFPSGPSSERTDRTSDTSIFDIAPRFRDPAQSESFYDGYITVEVRRGDAVIGSLTGDQAHHVTVYPYMHLDVRPPGALAKVNGLQRALGRHELGCATFQLELRGKLPHADQPVYALRAVIDPALHSAPELNGAEYTLDNETIRYGNDPGRRPGSWFSGRRLTKAQLLNDSHTVCVLLGRPRSVDRSQPVELKLLFSVIETPYDLDSTVNPFTLRVLVGPPTWIEKNGARLSLALGLALLLLHLWYARFRPTVPANLQVASGKPLSSPGPLGEGSVLRRWLGLTVEKPVLADHGSYTLGWVYPVNEELYYFRPASGISVVDPGYLDGNMVVSVNRIYEVGSARGNYQFRLQYA